MRMLTSLQGLLVAATLAGSLPCAATAPAAEMLVVQTDHGAVRGVAGHGVREFKGIPYALPPTGARRWNAPVPAAAWSGVLDASHARGICPQPSRYGLGLSSVDEDCLYLNVTTPAMPAKAGKRPVFVWIHGGVFVGGAGSIYPLDRLATRGDLVVVSLNYRLGALGFMAHPGFDAADNGAFGLEDQRLALRWVQANIAAFGGDPKNVTIAGESAGAGSVCMHLAAPGQTRGLFQKAIVQSAGCPWHLRDVAEAGKVGLTVAAAVGCADAARAVACMREVPVERLLAAQVEAGKADLLTYAPSVGTPVLPMQVADAFASGQFVRAPLLNGGTTDELRLFVAYDVVAGESVTADNYAQKIGAIYGPAAPSVLQMYPLSRYSSAASALGSVLSDFLAINGINHCQYLRAADLASRYVPVYEYEFADAAAPPVMPDPGFEMGAVHAAELPYLFPRFDNTEAHAGPPLAPASQRLADQMIALWSSFAHGGVPRAPGVRAWPPYHGGASALRLEPGRVELFDEAAAHHCAEWKRLYPVDLAIPAAGT